MQRPYLYQIIHTLRYKAQHIEAHCDILKNAFWSLKNQRISLSPQEIAAQIEKLLKLRSAPINTSTLVELRLEFDGRIKLIIVENSIYQGYALRCLSPIATVVTYDNPISNHPTSARRAAAELAQHQAMSVGADVAIRAGTDGMIYSVNDAPIFGVIGRTIYTPPTIESVEHRLVAKAGLRAKIEVCEMAMTRSDLSIFDELFWADSYGITAISRCDHRVYMSIIAQKIAALM